jgi:hypothetical protein
MTTLAARQHRPVASRIARRAAPESGAAHHPSLGSVGPLGAQGLHVGNALTLQRKAGNQAVLSLLESHRRAAPPPATPPTNVIQPYRILKEGKDWQEVEFTHQEKQHPVDGLYKGDGYYYEKVRDSAKGTVYLREKFTAVDKLKGAVAVYRGFHFKKTLDDNAHKAEIEKIVTNTPTFSSASYEIAIRVTRMDKPSITALELATKVVSEDLEKMRAFLDKDKPGKELAYAHRPTGPRQPGEDEEFTRKGRAYLNQLMAALSLYINNQKDFEKNLQDAEQGDFGGLRFVKVPFLSTSKSPVEAAKYAKGKVSKPEDVRTEGTVGRIHVYVAPLSAMIKMGAIDVVESHPNTVYVCTYRFGEQEVTYMGSIPAALLRGQTLVKADDANEAAGAKAQAIAEQEAKQYGGLRPYTTRQD